ncbi:O-antigen ligase family protein [Paenibacillus segetis]|uniref:O-antigen ligase-related domain-containing protein n=1 Tax=Paenibacillus segetis TaxID=1325360 RepID=A0ABQ1YU23_9BACL|nr:O-antigen ligase family protein [Paenibacillus segetis]GGH38896.1 hypothetical protein GCM10008013_47280 [Paenibacillus segetis]
MPGKEHMYIWWAGGGIVGTGLVVCLHNGLFYIDTRFSLLLISVWLVISAVVIAFCMTREVTLLPFRNGSLTQTNLLIWIYPFIIAALYSVHLVIGPQSFQATTEALLRWTFYGVFGVTLYRVGREKEGRRLLKMGWLAMGTLLVTTALATIYGILPLPHIILRTDNDEIAATGARLGGLLQYPNTFGMVMAVCLLERLMAIASLSVTDLSRKKLLIASGSTVLTLLIALCLLLTESRGAYVAAGVGWIAGWFLLRGDKRLIYLIQSGIVVIAAAFLAWQLTHAKLAPPLFSGLVSLVVVMAVVLMLSRMSTQVLNLRRRTYRYIMAYFCGGFSLLIAFVLLACGGLLLRLFRLGTLSARTVMYSDAWKLFKNAPWIGDGGDAWRKLFHSIQSKPYVGTEVHSGFLDILLDLGILGFLILMLGLFAIFTGLIKSRSILLPSCIVLVLHSAFDFDMSYGLVWMLLAWMVGLSFEESGVAKPLDRAYRGAGADVRLVRFIYGLLATLLLITGITGFRQAESLRLYTLANLSTQSITTVERVDLLQQSLTLDRSRTSTRLALASMSTPAAATTILIKGIHYDPGHPDLWLALGIAWAVQGDMRAIPALEHVANLDRYDREKQGAVLRNLVLLAMRLEGEHRFNEAQSAVSAGRRLYLRYAELENHLLKMNNPRNDRDFKLTEESQVWEKKLISIADLIANSME